MSWYTRWISLAALTLTLLALFLGGCGTGSGSASVSADSLTGGSNNSPVETAPGRARVLYQFSTSRIALGSNTATVEISLLDSSGLPVPIQVGDTADLSLTVPAGSSAEVDVFNSVASTVAATQILTRDASGIVSQALNSPLTLQPDQTVTLDGTTFTQATVTLTGVVIGAADSNNQQTLETVGLINGNSNQKIQLNGTGTYTVSGSSGTVISPINVSSLAWTSSNTSVASVNKQGLVVVNTTAGANQRATITGSITSNNATFAGNVVINATGIGSGISITLTQSIIGVGQTANYTVVDGNGNSITSSAGLTFGTSGVVSGGAGTLTGLAAGTTTITATSGNSTSAPVAITVTSGSQPTPTPTPVPSPGSSPLPTVSPGGGTPVLTVLNPNLTVNGTSTFTVTLNGTDVTSTASISQNSVVQQSGVGQIKGVTAGTTSITATVGGQTSNSVSVTVQ